MSVIRYSKLGLLRYGGYEIAQRLHNYAETRRLVKGIETFLSEGNLPLPKKVIFEATLRCNLRCRMCWQDRKNLANQDELALNQIVEIFNREKRLKTVTLIGGEIFVRQNIIDVMSFLNRSRNLVICTNGSLISKDVLARLSDLKRIFTFCISIDGDRSLHDDIRGVPGTFDRAVKAIAALAQRFPVTVNCVIQNRNLESLPDLVARLNDLGVRKIKLELERRYSEDQLVQTAKLLDIRSNQLPRASENGDRDYSFEQLEEVMKACIQRAQDGGLYLVFDPSFLAVRLRSCYYNQTRLEVPCICKRMQTATIAPNGDLLFCSIIRKPIGNLTQSCLEDLWNSPSAISLRKIMLENNMTHLCENCPGLVPVGDLRCGSGKWTKARGW